MSVSPSASGLPPPGFGKAECTYVGLVGSPPCAGCCDWDATSGTMVPALSAWVGDWTVLLEDGQSGFDALDLGGQGGAAARLALGVRGAGLVVPALGAGLGRGGVVQRTRSRHRQGCVGTSTGQTLDDVHLDIDLLLSVTNISMLDLLDDDLLSGRQIVLVSGAVIVDNVGIGLVPRRRDGLRLGQGQLEGGLLDGVGGRIWHVDDPVDLGDLHVADVDGTVVVMGVAAGPAVRLVRGVEKDAVRVGVRDAVVVPLGRAGGGGWVGLEMAVTTAAGGSGLRRNRSVSAAKKIVIGCCFDRVVFLVVLNISMGRSTGSSGDGEEGKATTSLIFLFQFFLRVFDC